MSERIYRRWGIFNYNMLWDTFPTRRDARDYARKILEGDKTLERHIREGSISIEKVVVQKKRWTGQWWRTKP